MSNRHKQPRCRVEAGTAESLWDCDCPACLEYQEEADELTRAEDEAADAEWRQRLDELEFFQAND